jgi:hypothetical protein
MGEEWATALSAIGHRIFFAQYAGLPLTIEVFPNIKDFIGLNGVSGYFSKIFGEEYISFSQEVMKFANPSGVANGTAGFMSTVFFAEGYAWFGLAGAFTSVLVVIVLFYFLDLFDYVKSSPLNLSLYMFCICLLPKLLLDGFTSVILNFGIILVVLVVLFANFINFYVLGGKRVK